MNNAIPEVCKSLSEAMKEDRQKILDSCAKEKLMDICKRDDEEFDNWLAKLDANIKYNDYNSVKICTVKLLSLLNKNRKILFHTLGRLY